MAVSYLPYDQALKGFDARKSRYWVLYNGDSKLGATVVDQEQKGEDRISHEESRNQILAWIETLPPGKYRLEDGNHEGMPSGKTKFVTHFEKPHPNPFAAMFPWMQQQPGQMAGIGNPNPMFNPMMAGIFGPSIREQQLAEQIQELKILMLTQKHERELAELKRGMEESKGFGLKEANDMLANIAKLGEMNNKPTAPITPPATQTPPANVGKPSNPTPQPQPAGKPRQEPQPTTEQVKLANALSALESKLGTDRLIEALSRLAEKEPETLAQLTQFL